MQSNLPKESTLFEIKGENSPFKFYRTATNFSTRKIQPKITILKETPYLFVPRINSYSIYTLDDLKLQFLGPIIQNSVTMIHSGVFVFVFTENTVYKTYRGEIKESIKLDNISIKGVCSFGSKFILYDDKTVAIYESIQEDQINDLIVNEDDADYNEINDNPFFNEVHRISYDKKISSIFHPHSYVNKILIVFEDGTVELYNINSNKAIFQYSFQCSIDFISQTSVVDVVGIVRSDGMIEIFNLKKNKSIFVISDFKGSKIRGASFKDKMAVFVTENDEMILFDLEVKKDIFRKSDVYSSIMINELMALIVTRNSLEIFTIDDLKTLKSRKILNEGILGISAYSNNEMILHSNESVFKMNIYRDEMCCFLKTKYPLERIDFECNTSGISENNVLDSNIVMAGEGKVSFIDKEGKFRNFINMKCSVISVFRDFCVLASKKKLVVMNLKSKRVISSLNIDESILDACLDNYSFTVLYCDRIERFSFDQSKQETVLRFDSKIKNGSIKKYNEMYFLEVIDDECVLAASSENESTISKRFDVQKYSVDLSGNVLVGIKDTSVRIYDIASGNLLDSINTNKKLKDICIMDKMKFICVLDCESNVHLLSNTTNFNVLNISGIFGSGESSLEIPVVKKESNFYKDLTLYKNFDSRKDYDLVLKGLNRDEVESLLKIIKKNLKSDFYSSQKLLKKLLLYKSSLLNYEDVIEIKNEIDLRLKEIEESVLSGIGFLSIVQSTDLQ